MDIGHDLILWWFWNLYSVGSPNWLWLRKTLPAPGRKGLDYSCFGLKCFVGTKVFTPETARCLGLSLGLHPALCWWRVASDFATTDGMFGHSDRIEMFWKQWSSTYLWVYEPNHIMFIFIWVFPKIMGTPKSSILIGFSIINHPFWGTPIFGNIHIVIHFWSVAVCSGKSCTRAGYVYQWSA